MQRRRVDSNDAAVEIVSGIVADRPEVDKFEGWLQVVELFIKDEFPNKIEIE